MDVKSVEIQNMYKGLRLFVNVCVESDVKRSLDNDNYKSRGTETSSAQEGKPAS